MNPPTDTKGADVQVTTILESALQELEERGWCKGTFENEDGVCINRALVNAISMMGFEWNEGGRDLMFACNRALSSQVGIANLALWNDHPDRTFSQVSEVFRRAIAEQELVDLRLAA